MVATTGVVEMIARAVHLYVFVTQEDETFGVVI